SWRKRSGCCHESGDLMRMLPLMTTDIPVGARIRFFRQGRKLTQAQVAAQSGLHQEYIGMIERGLRTPSGHALTRLAQVLGLSLPVLRGQGQVAPGGVGHPGMPA